MLLNCAAGEYTWVSWTARRSNQSTLKEINSEYSLEGLMLKFQYFGHLMLRASSLEKTLMLGKIEGKRRRGWQRDEIVRWHHWLNGHESEQTLRDGEGYRSLEYYDLWSRRVGDGFQLGFCINPFYRPGKLLKAPQSVTGGTRGPNQEV